MESKKNNTLFYVLGFLGEVIIFVGYYFILNPSGRTNVSWLNWAVISCIFALNYFGVSVMFTTKEKFSERIPGLGLIDYICIIYSIIALLVMYKGHASQLAFRYQLFIHIVLLFFVGVGFMIVMNSIEFVRKHNYYERSLQSKIETIRFELGQICSVLQHKPVPSAFLIRIQQLQEKFRHTSPVEKPEAYALESSIIDIITVLKSSEAQGLWEANENDPKITSLLDKLESLYSQRKTIIN